MNKILRRILASFGLLAFFMLIAALPAEPAFSKSSAAPKIAFLNPGMGALGVPVYTQVSVTFDGNMNPSTIHSGTFFVNRGAVPVPGSTAYISVSKLAVFRPDAPLEPSTVYTVTMTTGVQNQSGQPLAADIVWSFTTSDGASPIGDGMHIYFGDLHSHSGYSDGGGTPADAYATARANGLDFFALTDHSNQLDDVEWQDMLDQANLATVEGQFVGLRGFEFTHPQGHVNVFDTDTYVSETDPDYDTYAEFYAWLADQPTAIGQFNHPYKTDTVNWNFDDFAYNAAAAEKMCLREARFYPPEQYLLSLDAGWHLGAVDNSDTHQPDWGERRTTGLVASSLTKEAILEALRARRTFSTPDRNFALVLQANGYWMGSVIPNASLISFTITAHDPDPEFPILAIILYDNGVPVAVTTPLSTHVTYTWTPVVAGSPGHYYYAKAYFDIEGWVYVIAAYTSPVWTDNTPIPRWDLYFPLVIKE
jgi:hypothetical protein